MLPDPCQVPGMDLDYTYCWHEHMNLPGKDNKSFSQELSSKNGNTKNG